MKCSVAMFYVGHKGLILRIILKKKGRLHKAHQRKFKRSKSKVRGYFFPAGEKKPYLGTIVLPAAADLTELIPHEVSHAVLHMLGRVSRNDDEKCAEWIGILSSMIFKTVRRMVCPK